MRVRLECYFYIAMPRKPLAYVYIDTVLINPFLTFASKSLAPSVRLFTKINFIIRTKTEGKHIDLVCLRLF